MLEVRGLAKAYGGIEAVRGVSFTVARGEMLAMIGPNGAGKSTCFNMLGGQVRPDAGTVRLDGQGITGLPPRAIWRHGVGRTFQVTAAFGSMLVRENVQVALIAAAGLTFRAWTPATRRLRPEAEALLAQVGLLDQGERGAAVLAYGDLKRLELAVALAGRPRLLLMDEPTAGMAPSERTGLMGLVRRLATEAGLAVLFTEHDMDVVFGLADRVLVLDHGALLAEGSPAAIRAHPGVRAAYLGEG